MAFAQRRGGEGGRGGEAGKLGPVGHLPLWVCVWFVRVSVSLLMAEEEDGAKGAGVGKQPNMGESHSRVSVYVSSLRMHRIYNLYSVSVYVCILLMAEEEGVGKQANRVE